MRLLSRLIFFILFVTILGLVIAYARGYRLDYRSRTFSSTGIIAITSSPKTAKIYLNDLLKGVTDANLTLSPGDYQVDIKKDGYTSWSRKVNLKGELVINLDAVLFPINPSLSPLTNLGVIKAVPMQDNDKMIILAQEGVYLFEAARGQLPFFAPLKTIVKKSLLPESVDFSQVLVSVSPDLKQAIFEFGTESESLAYLLSLEEENQEVLSLPLTSKQTLIAAWEKQKKDDFLKILETYPLEFAKVASDSFKVISFSPNEIKVLYRALDNITLPPMITPPLIATNQTAETRSLKRNSLYVYDKKEDKNYEVTNPSALNSLTDQSVQWYSDSKHLVIDEEKKISIADYDNANRQTVYSGPFEANFFTPTSDGKIIVLANLNPEANKLPDLYLVGIR
ncbi:PEGA domain-containing protein [Candidatus Roizmanbacteria bacterium]|nr:PEGA domain-containing protein [Candidatus Roizmanbacteria bacterium]